MKFLGKWFRWLTVAVCLALAFTGLAIWITTMSHPVGGEVRFTEHDLVYYHFHDGLVRAMVCRTPNETVRTRTISEDQVGSRGNRVVFEAFIPGPPPESVTVLFPNRERLKKNGQGLVSWQRFRRAAFSKFELFTIRTPIGIPVLVLMLFPGVAFVRGPYRRHRRRKKGLCLHCGYNLTGNTSGVCPECGERI